MHRLSLCADAHWCEHPAEALREHATEDHFVIELLDLAEQGVREQKRRKGASR